MHFVCLSVCLSVTCTGLSVPIVITIIGSFFSIALHCISFLVLYCIVLFNSALLFVYLFFYF